MSVTLRNLSNKINPNTIEAIAFEAYCISDEKKEERSFALEAALLDKAELVPVEGDDPDEDDELDPLDPDEVEGDDPDADLDTDLGENLDDFSFEADLLAEESTGIQFVNYVASMEALYNAPVYNGARLVEKQLDEKLAAIEAIEAMYFNDPDAEGAVEGIIATLKEKFKTIMDKDARRAAKELKNKTKAELNDSKFKASVEKFAGALREKMASVLSDVGIDSSVLDLNVKYENVGFSAVIPIFDLENVQGKTEEEVFGVIQVAMNESTKVFHKTKTDKVGELMLSVSTTDLVLVVSRKKMNKYEKGMLQKYVDEQNAAATEGLIFDKKPSTYKDGDIIKVNAFRNKIAATLSISMSQGEDHEASMKAMNQFISRIPSKSKKLLGSIGANVTTFLNAVSDDTVPDIKKIADVKFAKEGTLEIIDNGPEAEFVARLTIKAISPLERNVVIEFTSAFETAKIIDGTEVPEGGSVESLQAITFLANKGVSLESIFAITSGAMENIEILETLKDAAIASESKDRGDLDEDDDEYDEDFYDLDELTDEELKEIELYGDDDDL